jgi:hypothetical protein
VHISHVRECVHSPNVFTTERGLAQQWCRITLHGDELHVWLWKGRVKEGALRCGTAAALQRYCSFQMGQLENEVPKDPCYHRLASFFLRMLHTAPVVSCVTD